MQVIDIWGVEPLADEEEFLLVCQECSGVRLLFNPNEAVSIAKQHTEATQHSVKLFERKQVYGDDAKHGDN